MLKVETNRGRLGLILAVTLASVLASVVVTLAVMGDEFEARGLFIAVLVPAIVAPLASISMTGLMQRNARLTRQMEYLLRHDQMTGLLTRGAFYSQMSEQNGVFLMLDLDFFKSINDTHGHAAGDAVIRETAARIAATPEQDVVSARFGGEEFILFLPGHDLQRAQDVAEDLRRRIREAPVVHDGRKLTVTASIGLAGRASGESVDTVLRRADAALYEAKALGRDRVVAANTDREPDPMGADGPPASSFLRGRDRRTA